MHFAQRKNKADLKNRSGTETQSTVQCAENRGMLKEIYSAHPNKIEKDITTGIKGGKSILKSSSTVSFRAPSAFCKRIGANLAAVLNPFMLFEEETQITRKRREEDSSANEAYIY